LNLKKNELEVAVKIPENVELLIVDKKLCFKLNYSKLSKLMKLKIYDDKEP